MVTLSEHVGFELDWRGRELVSCRLFIRKEEEVGWVDELGGLDGSSKLGKLVG